MGRAESAPPHALNWASRSPRFRHSSPKMRKKITHYKIDVTVAVLKISDNSEHAVMKRHLKKQKQKTKQSRKKKKTCSKILDSPLSKS